MAFKQWLAGLFGFNPGPGDDFWYDNVPGSRTASGARINSDSAMRITTVYSCINVLANSVASLPLVLYRRDADGGKTEATDHPLYHLLKYRPNGWMTRFSFIRLLVVHGALRGNFYSQVLYGPSGYPEQLIPLHPDRMDVELTGDYTKRFLYQEKQGARSTFLASEIFHYDGLSDDGIKGMSPIKQARQTLGIASETEAYAASFFGNDSTPGGILSSDVPLDEKTRTANREAWERMHRGARNSHKVAVLSGMKWQPISMSHEDSQFLETRKFSKAEICGLFGIPPHIVADLERATFSNIEHQDIGFYKHTIRHWVTNIEQVIKRDLIMEDDLFAEFKVDALLRGDSKTRAEYYSKALGSGGSPAWMTPNEVRKKENLDPIEGGDRLPEATNVASFQETPNEDDNEDT